MRNTRIIRSFFVLLLLLSIFGCSDPDDEEGGIIGTGLRLEGTVTEIREFASNNLDIKATSGELTSAIIDDTGRYLAPAVKGDGPYLLRVDLGNSEYRYGVAFGNDRANVHSYTDVILRNWFETNDGDIDNEFDQTLISTALPSRTQYKQNAAHFFDLTDLVLSSYGLTGEELLTGNYDSVSEQNGIDQYLRSNPAIIKDNTISFVITDPLNQTQSTTKSDFAVFELASEPDNQAPDVPTSVKALPSASNEIVIVWEPSSDNRGVVAYEVFRDGNLIATTPFPVYFDTDSQLIARQLYKYQVISVDASDNSSALSVEATSSTLDEPDNTSPPAPVQLAVDAEMGRMQLIWGQTNIGDVVSFDVYRGRGEQPIAFLKSVTSTIMTDVSVSSGVQYCYQIVAVDASGNESDRGSTVCETAEGQEVNRSISPLASSVPPLAGLTIPDTEAMACTVEWDQFGISESVSVDAGCYLVNQSINVMNGGTLTLTPGVVMKFGAGVGVTVNTGGVLSSKGTKDSPVVLTAQDPTPGYWDGLVYSNSNSVRNELLNTVVEFAGGSQLGGAVVIYSSSAGRSSLLVTDSVIRDCVDAGLKGIGVNSDLRSVDGVVITGCGWPLEIAIAQTGGITQRNSFTGNEDDWVDLGTVNVVEDAALKDLGLPYVVSNFTVRDGAFMTILAGVEVQFRSGAQFEIVGNMSTLGEEDRRVRFTGTRKSPGHWVGLNVRNSVSLVSTDVMFAGFPAPVVTRTSSISVLSWQNVSFSDVIVTDGASFGLNIHNRVSDKSKTLDGFSLYRNAKSIKLPIELANQLSKNLKISDNVVQDIELFSTGSISAEVDLFDVGYPYYLQGEFSWAGGALRIHENTTLHMADNALIRIDRSAYVNIVGTENSPVTVTHLDRVAGAWAGIEVLSVLSNNIIEHTNISFAGGPKTSTSTALLLDCDTKTALNIANTAIEDSAGWGIYTQGDNDCSPSYGENVQLTRNRLGNMGSAN